MRLAALGLVALTAAACSSSGEGDSSSPAPSAAPTTAPATSTPASSSAPSTSAPPTSSSAPSSSAPSSSAPPASSTPVPSSSPTGPSFVTTCTNLVVRVIPGGAVRGAEIAGVQYENDSSRSCTITGVPTAQLRLKGRDVGPVSQPTTDPVRTYTLEPGAVGESLLQDFSTCNAPLSDQIRVTVPTRTGNALTTVVRPIQLRACTLRLAPVGPQG